MFIRMDPIMELPTGKNSMDLQEARRAIDKLTERNRTQANLIQAWKLRLKEQNDLLLRLHREREEQMRVLTSQLLLLEANMRRKQSKIDGLLSQRDRTISSQQETIRSLEKELERLRFQSKKQSPPPTPSKAPVSGPSHQTTEDSKLTSLGAPIGHQIHRITRLLGRDNDESLEDSDSAVVIEDDHHRHSPTFAQKDAGRISQVRVIRSISDVVASSRLRTIQQPPEVEEEDEEDGESYGGGDGSNSSSSDDSPFNRHKVFMRGSFERTPVHPQSQPTEPSVAPGLYRSQSASTPRCCSNHRSVTRPRDVKSKQSRKMTGKCIAWNGTTSVIGKIPPKHTSTSYDDRGFPSTTV